MRAGQQGAAVYKPPTKPTAVCKPPPLEKIEPVIRTRDLYADTVRLPRLLRIKNDVEASVMVLPRNLVERSDQLNATMKGQYEILGRQDC
jgi:hypothetical protein